MPCAAPTLSPATVCPSHRDAEQALPVTARLAITGMLAMSGSEYLCSDGSLKTLQSAGRHLGGQAGQPASWRDLEAVSAPRS